jgi:hypothetical protein
MLAKCHISYLYGTLYLEGFSYNILGVNFIYKINIVRYVYEL